ncbi:MAG TPA: SGNH/GDSL hydrolase family protein [Bryobacteraceae bacterium]|nr:SGNH/GDSL hydrolase family protein [Bryobacteraceae bacterium]
MRSKVVALAAVLLAAPCGVAFGISINTFNQIVSFGDSLSDPGNVSIATLGVFPGANYAARTVAGVPFPVGYYTDGPNTTPGTGAGPTGLWIDQLATKMSLPDPGPTLAPAGGGTNYAVASALTGNTSQQDMQNQVNLFLSQHLTGASASALYTFWGGANDLLGGNNPKQAADNIFSQIREVAADGGKYFLWLNLPSLGLTPEGSADAAALNAASAAFNAEWSTDVSLLDSSGIYVIGVDVSSLFNQILATPSAFGFTDVKDSAQGLSGVNPNNYLFWDDVHPTTAGDMYVANLALADITAAPEPASYVLILLGGCGLLALCGVKRKQPADNKASVA